MSEETEEVKKNVLGNNDAGKPGNAGKPATGGTDKNADAGLSQSDYEKKIAELDKREKAIDEKLQRMETINERIQSEGVASGGGRSKDTVEETQKKTLLKNFGGCIDGLDKML